MSECPNSPEKFLQLSQDTIQLFSPMKTEIIRYDKKKFMTKTLRKATMNLL